MKAPVVLNRPRTSLRQASMILPCLLAPIGILALSAVPAIDMTRATLEKSRYESEVREVARLRRTLRDAPSGLGVAELEQLTGYFQELLPGAIDTVQLYGRVRTLAAAAAVELEVIRFDGEEVLGLEANGQQVAGLLTAVSGRGTAPAMLGLLSALRAEGYPLSVRGVDLIQDPVQGFRFELELLFLRRAPASSEPSEDI